MSFHSERKPQVHCRKRNRNVQHTQKKVRFHPWNLLDVSNFILYHASLLGDDGEIEAMLLINHELLEGVEIGWDEGAD